MALDAGLGEAGRNGLVITPEYGPRFRLAKIITDLPVAADGPISFGVTEFCEVCGKCALHCPGKAISKGTNARTFDTPNLSSNPGVYRWQVNAEKCYQVWVKAGHDCANCLRSCPFNKPDSWYHSMTMTLVGLRLPILNRMIVWIDDAFGFGKRKPSSFFWHLDVKPAKSAAVGGKPSSDQKEIQSTAAANVATPQDVFDRIQRKLESDSKLTAQTASYQFDVTGENGGKWFVLLDGDQSQVVKGELPNAACKIKVSDMDLVALATGKLSGPKAVARGRVEMQGQIKLALKLDSLLS
jgi:ferredoxin